MGKLKVLVLGDGLLGKEIVKKTSWDYISRKKDQFNIEDVSSWNFKKYDIILNCIANTDTYSTDKNLHWLVNYKFVHDLLQYCNMNQLKLIHISTEYLYSNSVNDASEEDVPVHCNNWYGYTKLLGDGIVQLLSNNYLVCRCMHKPNPFPYKEAWIDQIGNFDYVDKISDLIIKAIENDLCGVYNIGTNLKTIYDLAIQTNPEVKAIQSSIECPKNISMSIDKYESSFIPYFSIAIPTYEYGGKGVDFLEYSFEKIKIQTFKNFEVVISDHSKNSDIEDLCNRWKNIFKIKYIKNDHGRGIISPNINVAMKNCGGKYIKILFQDDFLLGSSSLQITYDFIKSKKEINWMATSFYHSIDGINMYRPLVPEWNNEIWTGKNTMGCPTGFCIKNENIILFDENLNWLMDVDFYKKMFDKYGEPEICEDFTVVNRTWGERLTDTINQDIRMNEFNIMINRYSNI